MVFTSNVGASSHRKTLWVFGAGASSHLGFPLSYDFFSKSIGLCTAWMRFPNETDPRYHYFSNDFPRGNEPSLTCSKVREFKSDPELALRYIDAWTYLEPGHDVMAELAYLYVKWRRLPTLLADIGLKYEPRDLLAACPEQLIAEVRKIKEKASGSGADGGAGQMSPLISKLNPTRDTLHDIYFYTLSYFNEKARDRDLKANLYRQLVRSFILEKNARLISFNYDTMLDEAIFHDFTRTWHYGGIDVAGINGYPVAKGCDGDLILIKPHGSLNFLICPNCKCAHVHWFWTHRQTGGNVAASDNRRCARCGELPPYCTEHLSPLIVPPLYDKCVIERSEEAIVDSLVWADLIVAIGYSFPAQDTHFLESIAQAISNRQASPLEIRIVSQNHTSAEEIRKRLQRQLAERGVYLSAVKLQAEDLSGFEGVITGSQ